MEGDVKPLVETQQAPLDPDTRLKIVGLGRAAERTPPDLAYLVEQVSDPSPAIFGAALRLLAELEPMASLPERWYDDEPPPGTDRENIPAWIRRSGTGWGRAGDLADLCVRRLTQLDSPQADVLMQRLARLLGLRRTLTIRLRRSGRSDLAWRFGRRAVTEHHRDFPKQIGVFPTLACQLHCGYCISAGLALGADNTLPLTDLRRLIAWARRDKARRLCVTGGEPTIYPHFVELLREAHAAGLEVVLATNGLGRPETTDAIIETRTESVTLHLAPETLGSEKLYAQYQETARRLIGAGLSVAMRCNLTTPDDDPRPFIRSAADLGFREMRMAVPIPNANRVNQFVAVSELTRFGKAIDVFVAEAGQRGIDVKLAKPFPLCRLAERTARQFILNGSMSSNCQVAMQVFTHNMLVHPDLTYSPCLALNMKSNAPILETRGLYDAARKYRAHVTSLMRQPLLEACPSCPLFKGGRCLGACLSYRLEGRENADELRRFG
ncbi:MAG: hypothetical protein BWK77_03080 [Verrucomicrobia bacterium A1]|nr:MAG: hypothetical protein BWK77_03080 [Verrucomicrobia bacterium A1]